MLRTALLALPVLACFVVPAEPDVEPPAGPATFLVKVIDPAGAPVSGATIVPQLSRTPLAKKSDKSARGPFRRPGVSGKTDKAGVAEISLMPAPDDVVFYVRDGQGREGVAGAVPAPGAKPTSVTIMIGTPSVLTILVTDTRGALVSRAWIKVDPLEEKFSEGHPLVPEDLVASTVPKVFDELVTDENGIVRVPLRFFGDYSVDVDAHSLPRQERDVRIEPGTDVTLKVVLGVGKALSGSVVDPNGKPVRRANVSATPQQQRRNNVSFAGKTNAEGEFHLRNLPPGRYDIWAEAPGLSGVVRDVDAGGSSATIRLQKAPAGGGFEWSTVREKRP